MNPHRPSRPAEQIDWTTALDTANVIPPSLQRVMELCSRDDLPLEEWFGLLANPETDVCLWCRTNANGDLFLTWRTEDADQETPGALYELDHTYDGDATPLQRIDPVRAVAVLESSGAVNIVSRDHTPVMTSEVQNE